MGSDQLGEYCKASGQAHRSRNCSEIECRESGKCCKPLTHSIIPGTPHPREVSDFAGKIDGGGYKASMDDPKKLPIWLVPVMLIRAVAAVLGYGKRKYAANNWRKGMAWSEVYSALQRHLTAWLEGEDNDDESKLHHLWHAACCLAFLIEYTAFPKLYGRFDDRFKRPTPEDT